MNDICSLYALCVLRYADVWYSSCVDLVNSRFFQGDFQPYGISDLKVQCVCVCVYVYTLSSMIHTHTHTHTNTL